MMRILAIVGGLAVGLLGLFMSVCGGGLLVSVLYDTFRNLFGTYRGHSANYEFIGFLLPAGSLVIGVVACWSAYRILRKNFRDE